MDATTTQPGEGPLYVQVKSLIIDRIVNGVWQPGDAIPSETRLAEEFGVSQGTVRKALDDLMANKIVVRQQGKGTFVAAHTPQRALFHFFHLVGDDGSRQLPTTSRLLACRRRRASRKEAAKLSLGAGARVVHIERVREMAGRPVIVEHIVVPAKLFPALEQTGELPNELYQLYEKDYAVTVHRAVEHLRAVAAGKNEARQLAVSAGAPLLEIDRLAESVDGRPIEWRRSRCSTRNHYYLSTII